MAEPKGKRLFFFCFLSFRKKKVSLPKVTGAVRVDDEISSEEIYIRRSRRRRRNNKLKGPRRTTTTRHTKN